MDLLIGRESELAVLSEVVDATASGHGGAVLIEGEAGIGKTRLLAPARTCVRRRRAAFVRQHRRD